MTIDLWLTALGLVVAIIGFFFAKTVKSRRNSQVQKTRGAGSINIQSGRDTQVSGWDDGRG